MLSHSSEYLDILRKTVSTLFASSSEAEQYSRTMARYLHSLIKSGDIAEDDWRLNVILELLRLLNHQDFFLHEFENMLAERLLQYGISRAVSVLFILANCNGNQSTIDNSGFGEEHYFQTQT